MALRLDLGCGPNPREGFEGVDIAHYPGVPYVCDLESHPWLIESMPTILSDNSVEAVFTSHLVEHIRDLVGFMRELHRVCEPGALVDIHHPYQFNVRAWQDPTHVRCINEVSWFYYDAKWRGDHLLDGPNVYGATDFELVELDAIPDPWWEHVAKDNPEDFERAARNMVNVISDLHVTLRCRK